LKPRHSFLNTLYMTYTHFCAVSLFHTSRSNGSPAITVKPNSMVAVSLFYIAQTKSYQRLHSTCVTVTSSHNPKVRGASVAPHLTSSRFCCVVSDCRKLKIMAFSGFQCNSRNIFRVNGHPTSNFG